ncbi:MAG: class I SAM-dependent methyltransferase, partial [Eggerthellaceae bacterium]|nr:class I SAM-dependent methyltransferase [Eggerthellaceae bacterium]
MAAAVPAGHPERPQGEEGRAMLERMNGGAHEQLALWGLERLEVVPGARILDVGCGGGGNVARMLALSDDVFVAGIDYAPLSVNMSREVNSKAIEQQR